MQDLKDLKRRSRGTGPRATGQEEVFLAMRCSGAGTPELQSPAPNPAHFFAFSISQKREKNSIIAKRAGFEGKIEQIELTEPHGGYAEIAQAVAQSQEELLKADAVVANMTGGTTLMGIVIQQMTEEARKLGRDVRRFALVDRRPPAEQDNNPFVQGEAYWLDKPEKKFDKNAR